MPLALTDEEKELLRRHPESKELIRAMRWFGVIDHGGILEKLADHYKFNDTWRNLVKESAANAELEAGLMDALDNDQIPEIP